MADNYSDAPLSLEKRIFNLLKFLIKYPFIISARYEAYNKGIGDLLAVKNEKELSRNPAYRNKEDNYFRNFQSKNTRLVYSFVYGPMLMGIVIASLFIYMNRAKYKEYIGVLTVPIQEERLSKKMSYYWAKGVYFFKKNPVSREEVYSVLAGYIVAILGAKFLSRNPFFDKQDDINSRLTQLKCLDMNGKPWRFVYTEDAVLIVSFGEDPNKLINTGSFWASLNFPPGTLIQSKKDMNKFVVMKKNSVAESIVFKLGEHHGI